MDFSLAAVVMPVLVAQDNRVREMVVLCQLFLKVAHLAAYVALLRTLGCREVGRAEGDRQIAIWGLLARPKRCVEVLHGDHRIHSQQTVDGRSARASAIGPQVLCSQIHDTTSASKGRARCQKRHAGVQTGIVSIAALRLSQAGARLSLAGEWACSNPGDQMLRASGVSVGCFRRPGMPNGTYVEG